MIVTDTLTVELTFVHHDIDEDELMIEEDYKNFFKSLDGMAADDVHIKKLKHFVSEDK